MVGLCLLLLSVLVVSVKFKTLNILIESEYEMSEKSNSVAANITLVSLIPSQRSESRSAAN